MTPPRAPCQWHSLRSIRPGPGPAPLALDLDGVASGRQVRGGTGGSWAALARRRRSLANDSASRSEHAGRQRVPTGREWLAEPKRPAEMEAEDLGAALIKHSALIATGRLMSYLIVPSALSACSGGSAVTTDRASSSDNLWSIVFHSYITCLAVAGAWELGFNPADRWLGRSEPGVLAGLLICADNLCQLPVQFSKNVPLSKSWTVLAHHVAQTGTFLLALHTGRCHFWGILATVSEATNPPISVVFTLKECKLDTASAPAPSSSFYMVASMMCWLSFVAFRMVLYPSWLLAFASDLLQYPAVSLGNTSAGELLLYPTVMLLMFYLSVLWFKPLTEGTRKVWREWSELSAYSAPRGNWKRN
eukprot:COSAG02_NODE_3407_length_6793_cov_3.608157_3_plen_361_part_00